MTTASRRHLISLQEAQEPYYLGVDVGGISTKFGLVDDYGRTIHLGEEDDQGRPRGYVSAKTEAMPQVATQIMAKVIRDMVTKSPALHGRIAAIGLGIPGTMDRTTKKLRRPPNLPSWEGFTMTEELHTVTGIPVIFCNDANAAAYGEYWVGSASSMSSVALLTLGTGIGTGIIIDGVAVEGFNGYGGECGHLVIDITENARLCGCGQRGHLEAYASALAVARRTLELTTRRKSTLRQTITPDVSLSSIPKLVYQAAENGDTLAVEIVKETACNLSAGILSILNTVDPACILLGGAMTFGGKDSPVGRMFLQTICDEVRQLAFPAVAQHLTIDFATLGSDAGFIGAAGIARETKGGNIAPVSPNDEARITKDRVV